MNIIIFSTALISILGLVIGLFLGFAAEKFKVEVNEKVINIRELLPGNNCGGCGYAGCDALAEAIANGKAHVNACPVGGSSVAEKIAAIMGTDAGKNIRKVAYVHCDGTCVNAKNVFTYTGYKDCRLAMKLPNVGEKACRNACLGYGTCVEVCQFDAIHIIDGVAVVDKEKCKACGACVKICPMKLIEIVPYDKKHLVKCSNNDKAKDAMSVCKVSCIGCGACNRECARDAINVINNVAIMDIDKCDDCGACKEKCVRKCIS